jgi:FtsH-binding integral membrane protein
MSDDDNWGAANDDTTPLTRTKQLARPNSAELWRFLAITYTILGSALSVIFGFSLAALLCVPLKGFMDTHTWALWLAMSVVFCIIVANVLIPEIWSAIPALGIFFFILFVFCASYCFGVLSASFTTTGVLIAVGMTVLIAVFVSLFAHFSGSDFTGAMPYLVAALAGFAVTAIVLIAVPSPLGTKLWAALGAVLFSMFLIFDTQWLSKDVRFAASGASPAIVKAGRCNLFRRPPITTSSYVAAASRLLLDILNVYALTLFVTGLVRNK